MRISDWSSDVCSSDLHALLGVEVIFYPEFLASGVHPHIRMRTVAVHVAPGTRQAALAHHVGDLMRAFGIVGPEVTLHVVVAKPCVRKPLLAPDEVRKLHRVAYEEVWSVVAHKCVITKLRKASW